MQKDAIVPLYTVSALSLYNRRMRQIYFRLRSNNLDVFIASVNFKPAASEVILTITITSHLITRC
jgi:hypothetical protein